MPRQPRLNLPGYFYHVMVRGIERGIIFRNAADKLDFLQRLGDGLVDTGCRCFAWALMSNHLHLLLLSGARGLVSLLHPLLTGYAVTFNSKYRRAGHLFQNRYKAIICQEDPYFLELVRYIGLQPVRAGLVRTPEALVRYSWTSHRVLMGEPGESWLEVDDVLQRFGADRKAARRSLANFMLEGWGQGRRQDLEGGGLLRSVGGIEGALAMKRRGERQMADPRILGDGSFVENILRQAETREQTNRGMRLTYTTQDLQQSIADFANVEPAVFYSNDRSRTVTNARAMFIYGAKEWLGVTGAALERLFGIASGTVSKAYKRGQRLAKDRQLFAYLNKRKNGSSVP